MGQRIIVIGYSGSGKSTLAQELGELYQCEVLHLDCVHWLSGWRERDKAEKDKIVSEFMDSHNEWVIDGNYKSTCYDRRMNEATQILFLDFPVCICLYRAVKRYFVYRGKSRESITKGCNEKIHREFLWWILYEGRNKKHKEWYRSICREYAQKVLVLKNSKAVKQFWENLSEQRENSSCG